MIKSRGIWGKKITLLFVGAVATGLAVAKERPFAGGEGEWKDEGKMEASGTSIREPFSVDFHPDGSVWVVEFTKGNRILRIDRQGRLTRVGGVLSETSQKLGDIAKGDGGPVSEAVFNGMHDLAIAKNGEVFVVDTFCHRVRKIDRAGVITTIAGTGKAGFSGDGGPADKAEFREPYSLVLTPDQKALLVVDLGNARLRKIDLTSGLVSTIAGNGAQGAPVDGAFAVESSFRGPRAVTVAPDGTIYLVTREGNSMHEISPDGRVTTVVNATGEKGTAGDGGPAVDARLNGPKYAAMTQRGEVLIVDTENHSVRLYDPKAKTLRTVAGIHGKKGSRLDRDPKKTELARPHGVRVDSSGRLFIADSDNHRILVFEAGWEK